MKKFLILIPLIFLFAFLKKDNKTYFACGVKYRIIAGGDGGRIIDGSVYSAGDTLMLNASSAWSYCSIDNLVGTPSCPIVIMSSSNDSVVNMTAGLALHNCKYVKITGRQSTDTDTTSYLDPLERIFLIKVGSTGDGVGVTIDLKSKNIEVDMVEVYKKTYAIWCKNEVSCDTTLNYNGDWSWRLDSMNFHHIYAHNIGQDIFYIGSTGQLPADRPITCDGVTKYYVPMAVSNIKAHHNYLDSSNRSGIQVGGGRYGYQWIAYNIIKNTGYEYVQNQGTGISIGGMTGNCNVHGNLIYNTFLYGIADFGGGWANTIDSNRIDSAGYIYINPSINADSLATAKNLASRPGNILYNGGLVGSHPSNIYSTVKTTYPNVTKTVIISRNMVGQNATTQDSTGIVQFSNDTDPYKQNWTQNNIVCSNTKIVGGGAATVLRFTYNAQNWPVYSTSCSYKPKTGLVY